MRMRGYFLVLILAFAFIANAQRNVLFIAVDDLKPLIGSYGDEIAITPNIDRLASMGVTFTNAHCQQAVCGPSRASLLTGLRPDLTEVWDLKTMIRDKNPNILTLPQHFRQQGYETVGMGKIYDPRSVDKDLDEASWSTPYIMPPVNDPTYGEPYFSHYQSSENKNQFDELRTRGEAGGLSGGELNKFMREGYKPSVEMLDIADEGYFDGMVAKTAVMQLQRLSKVDKPFLLCVGFKKPHLPFAAPKKYWDLYDREKLPLAEFQNHAANTIELPYHNSGELNSYTDIPDAYGANGLVKESKQRELIHGYYACVSYIDAQIGRVLDALEANGLKGKTSIVLWGDHGWHLGDHRLWNKHTNFEQATRVPLIFADPRYEKGVQNESPVEFVDIFPTLCELSGIPIPGNLQGKSLAPVISGQEKAVKEFAVSQYPRAGHMGYALRNDRYRYVAWYKDGDISDEQNILFKELYDYKKDPQEKVNVVALNTALAEDLQAQLSAHLRLQTQQKKAFKKATRPEKKSSAAIETGANLIDNGGFEDGDKGWRIFGKCKIEVVDDQPYSGNNALRFTGSKGGALQLVKDLRPETTYEVSVLAKTQNNEAVILKVVEYGGEDIKIKSKESDYVQLSAEFTTGKGQVSAKIGVQKYGEGTGLSWFDDVSLVEKKSAAEMIRGASLKSIIEEQYNGDFYLGATINHDQLGTEAEAILTSQFNYTVPENCAKQSRVHPEPGVWDWLQVDAVIEMAEKNDLTVRLHGPISPQASKWAKDDVRTPKELEKVMEEYMTAQCKKFNGHPNIKWMDVVNETVETDGTWFGPKEDIAEWENPWTIIGSDNDKNQTPLYISRAFEIANKFAPDISQVYNHHGGMEPVMWERVKETILYLRAKGLRVDGMGWQGHLRSDRPLALSPQELDYLSSLIDWAHANDLDFHVTEIDYKIWDGNKTEEALRKQADAYANVLKILLAKRATGVVTFNSWGIVDGRGRHADKFLFMFDEEGTPKPAYYAVREALLNPEAPLVLSSKLPVFSDDFENGDFEKSWIQFGQNRPELVQKEAANGKACVMMAADKTGMKKQLNDLKPKTKYGVEVWIKAPSGMVSAVKVDGYGGEQIVSRVKGDGEYQLGTLEFETGATSTSAELVINRWKTEGGGQVYIDSALVFEITE
ncbi:sulfatase-like hydrolase/transferase [Marinoscillum sp. MHG1-6]|uniref:sulfatase-like hydrolase/transferase n=1 Tax=Marinoscillum sp. MHG1-6 TaxID=2959627 RepID=UPI0021573F58|nr:sulfatase-like hydrolase/transferase [Marinoscillum sp. MHG1-6]